MVTIALSPTRVSAPWRVRWITLALWALAAGLVAFWALRLGSSGPASLPSVVAAEPVQINAAAMAQALGAVPSVAAAPAAPSRFALLGVLAGRDSGGGAAVIAVDGQPARPFKVGAQVSSGLVLQSLSARQAQLGPQLGAASTLTLQLPTLDKP